MRDQVIDFTVGGERISLTYEQVVRAMKDVVPEPYQKYVMELGDTVYPPKQVFSLVTGRGRQTFTTMEAQRVLTRLGFVCREAAKPGYMQFRPPSEILEQNSSVPTAPISEVESELATIKLAIAELIRRVEALEGRSEVA
jgi:hypothetical protein